MGHMELFRFYNTEAEKRNLLSHLLRHIAKRHLREAIRSAKYYPDPLELDAALLGKERDLWESAKEYEEVVPRQRAWIDTFKDPDGSRQQRLCLDLATAGAARSLLGQFDQSLFWYMEALKEFNQLSVEARAGQVFLEDSILAGIVRSLLAQFRYEDALAFIESALEGEMFSAYQSEVRHQFRVQKEVLPAVVKLTQGLQVPRGGA